MFHNKTKCGFFLNLMIVWSCSAKIHTNQNNVPARELENLINTVIIDSIPHPKCPELKVYFFRPGNSSGPFPTVYFCHGIGASDPQRYRFLIDYVIRHNVCVCYSSYSPFLATISPVITYSHLWRGFVAGHKKWRRYIDDTRIGFIGHSYGGGAAPNMAWRAVHRKRWGSKACFVYVMAPWYCHSMNANRFEEFPAHTILVTQVFEDDYINDYRMAADIYRSFKIPEQRKCFISVYSAKSGTEEIPAGHSVPEVEAGDNYLGRYVVFPVIDTLIQYSFVESAAQQSEHTRRVAQMRTTGKENGWECRFYKGNKCVFKRPQSKYLNFWSHAMNPRLEGTRLMLAPVRLGLQTPQTLLRYCAAGLDRMGQNK